MCLGLFFTGYVGILEKRQHALIVKSNKFRPIVGGYNWWN